MTWLDKLYIFLPDPLRVVRFQEITHIREEVQLSSLGLGVLHEQV